MNAPSHIFNRRQVRVHRDRAAGKLDAADFMLREMADSVCGRLDDIDRAFPVALDLGAHTGIIARTLNGRGGIERLVQSDLSPAMLQKADGLRVAADEEFLPFAESSFDLVMSAGSLHWVNDLPGALIQIRHILRPGGMFVACLPGGATLRELRDALEQAELAETGGLSPRVSPFIDARDGAGLLQRAGFAMPVADSDALTVTYADPLKLLYDLRDMGEANAMREAAHSFTRRKIIFSAMEYYARQYAGADGRVAATFELVTLTGWKAK